MSDTSRIANLEAASSDVAAYLDELRAALAGHDSAFREIRLRDMEQKLAPSLAGPGVPTAPRVVMGGDVSYAGVYGASAVAFGGGADGDVTISTGTDLTHDMYYENLTVNAGIRLNTAGSRVFVSGLLTNNGYISSNGVAGSAAAHGDGATAGFVGGGSAGGNGRTAEGGAGYAGTDISASFGGAGGAGGQGYPSGAAGAAGAATDPTSAQGTMQDQSSALRGLLSDGTTKVQGGSGGGGGGSPAGYYGGGGGGGGGVVLVIARVIANASGVIEANGANGGNGEASGGDGGGGGGGGGGGVVLVASMGTAGGTLRALGGAGGTAGSYYGVGGAVGTVIELTL